MASDASGLIWWSSGDKSAGLAVRDAVVVACWPPDAAAHVGRDARQVWRDLATTATAMRWIPAGEVVEERLDLIGVHYRRTVAAWSYRDELAGGARVSVGWLPDSRWWVDDTDERSGWVLLGLVAEQGAHKLAAARLTVPRRMGGIWQPTIAEYEPGTNRAAKTPPSPPGHRLPPGGGSSLTQTST